MSYKGQALTLEFASKMITHVQEAKQQQVELVTIAIDTDLVLQGSASNSQIGRKAVCNLFQTLFEDNSISDHIFLPQIFIFILTKNLLSYLSLVHM